MLPRQTIGAWLLKRLGGPSPPKKTLKNESSFVYNVIMLGIVYAIVLSQAAQAHASRKNQRLIHERVTRCVTRGTVENLNTL